MVGYKNDKYLNFGRCAAWLDDTANYLPSRLTAPCISPPPRSRGWMPKMPLASGNVTAASTQAPIPARPSLSAAGALHVELGGNAYYFGKLYEKASLGDPDRPVEPADITRTCRLMYGTSVFLLALIELVWYGALYFGGCRFDNR